MIFLKDKSGNLYCYDDSTAVTLVFKYDKWKISREDYCSIKHRSDIEEISLSEANKITRGADFRSALDMYSYSLGITM